MVPYDDWYRAMTGGSFNELMGWQRNHFDRLVHFCYGLLLVYPIRELFLRVADVKGFWGYFLPFDLALSTSLIFELIEWMVVELVASDLGMTYLGTQGDVWDVLGHDDQRPPATGLRPGMAGQPTGQTPGAPGRGAHRATDERRALTGPAGHKFWPRRTPSRHFVVSSLSTEHIGQRQGTGATLSQSSLELNYILKTMYYVGYLI
jgi:hypothetical protein